MYGAHSVANTILGGKAFEWGKRTAHSVTHEGLVNGKVIQLVKAPVWLRGYHLCDTAEIVKEELVLSVTHCHPGPHAFILLVEADLPFTSACARAVEEHLQLFGESVWSHTIVLFTCVDWLGSTTIDQYIKGEGNGLTQLLKRCGDRYYTFDSTKEYKTLSQELLVKIENLVGENNGRHFEIEENELQRIREKREQVKHKAEARSKENRTQKDKEVWNTKCRKRKREQVKHKAEARSKENRTQKDKEGEPLSEFTIVLLGWVIAKKSAVGNAILGITDVEGRTETHVKETRVVGERRLTVTVVDTPGWWKFFSANLVPSTVKSEIMKAVDQDQDQDCPQDQASSSRAFLLMIPADTSFTNEQRKIIEDNMKPFGEQVWENTIVVFSSGNCIGEYPIEQHIESEGDALIWLVEKCGNRYLVFDDEKEEVSQVVELLDKVEEMLKKKMSGGQTPQTLSTTETEDHTAAVVDEDLKKMVEVLYRVWDWGLWETEEVRRRFYKRSMQAIQLGTSSMNPPVHMSEDAPESKLIRLKTYHNREEMEKVLKEETRGRSLEELMRIAFKVYFRKECGVFDIVSIISGKDTFKQEWKQLFEREWARREVRLMEYVAQRCSSLRETDDNLSEPDPKKMKETIKKVSAWMDGVGTQDSAVSGLLSEEWTSDPEDNKETDN
ncbi:GTPase IMAP family member 8-like [Centroberyx affinis]|uniref:GTPase IMAP family member 8-like n=1 Tax=Centroberyx affinis TaxID=166261 RepID=UPI003A5BA143